jgi:hypothetical protein
MSSTVPVNNAFHLFLIHDRIELKPIWTLSLSQTTILHQDGWYDSARRHWMIFLPGTLWGCIGSLGMLRCKEMKSLTCSEGTVLFNGLLGLSLSWGVSRQNIRRLNAGWKYSICYCGVVLVVHSDRLENWFLALTWLQGPDHCTLIGYNPGLLLASLLDITPWEDIYI